MTVGRPGDGGYALIAALFSLALLASLSQMMLLASQGTLVMAGAETDRARLTAAADAGVTLALQGLLQADRGRRWAIDGAPHGLRFADATLAITIVDERGKIPLNRINQHQAETMFAAFGLAGDDLDIAVDSFLDWRDTDDDPRSHGAEAEYYAGLGLVPRNANLRSVGELALIRGIGPALATRIIPYVTVDFGAKGDFDPRFASATARRVMAEEAGSGLVTLPSDATPIAVHDSAPIGDRDSLIDHPVTIRVEARSADGRARAERQLIVSLTGIDARPYLILGRD